ncbi:MAG: DUF4012 domain-containing protein [Candidatus Magasanikbacteria bacterium]|nr:DUF4012 domain-containing protein [Candidatus Magasanikbacteria bacterium]
MATRKKTIRRCSACQNTGHTKRTCPVLAMEKKKGKERVPVRSFGEKKKSKHMIDLRAEERDIPWSITPFIEKKKKQQVRVPVNFADMVSHATGEEMTKKTIVSEKKSLSTYGHFRIDKEKQKQARPSLKSRLPKLPRLNPMERFFEMVEDSKIWILEMNKQISWKTFAMRAVAFILLLALPVPVFSYYRQVRQTSDQVVEASTQGFLSLQSSTLAALHTDIPKAQADLQQALGLLAEANDLIEQEHHVAQYITSLLPVVGTQLKSRQYILQAGQHIALGNTYLIKGISEAQEKDVLMTNRLVTIRQHMRSATVQYDEALAILAGVHPSVLPVEHQQSFSEFKLLFAAFINDMKDLVELSQALEVILGSEDFRRYLLVFQNHHEIRPTGGFMGSFAVLDIQKGEIKNIEVPPGGTYDLKGQLDTYVEAPAPLQLVNARWEFQDANWWPDFPASARKMAWFYEHSRGSTVDGVIAINARMLERLLTVIGPVENEAFDIVLQAEDALTTLQQEVEIDYDKKLNQPKAVIGEVMGQLLETVTTLDQVDMIQLLTGLHDGAREKDIQVFFFDNEVEHVFQSFGWTGEIVQTSPVQDYLMVVNANLQGQKSDAKIEQTIDHQAVIQEDGRIINSVVITRKHTGHPGELFYGSVNTNYMRVYVPEGAVLLDAGGFTYPEESAFDVPEDWYTPDPEKMLYEYDEKIHAETGTRVVTSFGKTSFENWVRTAPGQESVVYFTYELPFAVNMESKTKEDRLASLFSPNPRVASRYSLFVQKQSGVESELSTTIIYPEGWNPIWRSNERMDLAINGATMQVPLRSDQSIGVVFEQK